MTDYILSASWCSWGRHRVEEVEGSLHGRDACSDCWDEHDETCGCERCRRVGLCPVHGYDLAACEDVAATPSR